MKPFVLSMKYPGFPVVEFRMINHRITHIFRKRTGAEALRLEMNDPANGQLIDPDCFEYALDNTRFRLNIVRNNRKVLRYLEEHHINTELYGEIVLHYTPLSKPQLESLSAVTLRLFFGELLF